MPRLFSSRRLGVHYPEPIVYAGDPYTAGDDPLPDFTFRAAPTSLSRACERRQQIFGVLEGCAPVVTLVDRPYARRKGLSRWVMSALKRPVRSAY